MQEREAAEKAFGSGQAEALDAEETVAASKTFEPGEGIAAAEATQDAGMPSRVKQRNL